MSSSPSSLVAQEEGLFQLKAVKLWRKLCNQTRRGVLVKAVRKCDSSVLPKTKSESYQQIVRRQHHGRRIEEEKEACSSTMFYLYQTQPCVTLSLKAEVVGALFVIIAMGISHGQRAFQQLGVG
jgi:hypothetical protein